MLQLDHEIGGYITLNNGKMIHIVKGLKGDPSIPHLQIVPLFPQHPIVSWHTHYDNISNDVDGLPDGSPRCIPSNTDIETYIQTALKYTRSCVSAVLSKWGYFFIIIPDELIRVLKADDNKQKQDKLRETIREEIKVINGKFFIDDQEKSCQERIPAYIEAMKNVLKIGDKTYGFVCYMAYRYLDNKNFFITL
jgi:hypothetical protein